MPTGGLEPAWPYRLGIFGGERTGSGNKPQLRTAEEIRRFPR